MTKHATIQNIADVLGLSRNTVSKALNNPSSVPVATRQKVLEAAMELNYKSMQSVATVSTRKPMKIVLISKDNQLTSTFFAPLVQKLSERARMSNMSLSVQLVNDVDVRSLTLPAYLHECDGIVMMEVLEKEYLQAVMTQGKPMALFDIIPEYRSLSGSFDVVTEQADPVYDLTRHLVGKGLTSIGYCGNINHCLGFRERYFSYRSAMLEAGLSVDPSVCIIGSMHEKMGREDVTGCLYDDLSGMKLPQAFVCANDYIAISLIDALTRHHIRVPEDLYVTGCDDVPDCCTYTPQLTSVSYSAEMIANNLLLLLADRIQNPDMRTRVLSVTGEAVYRDSTR